jgi:epoxide hydrolase-like predicted phosphatase
MDFSTIKNLIFDLGGVIINLNNKKTHDALASLSPLKSEEIALSLKESRLFDQHGNGNFTDSEFRNALRSLLQLNASDAEIDHAFNALLCDIPSDRLQLLKNLSKKYRLFLLSNTNFIHIEKVNEILFTCSGITKLNELFEKVYYSHEMKLSKPDIRIYQAVLAENKLNPKETVFIDDLAENTEGAKAAGIHAIQVLPQHSIIEIFRHATN